MSAGMRGGPTLGSLWAGTRWRKVLVIVALPSIRTKRQEAFGSEG
jgi:hypothetical protein